MSFYKNIIFYALLVLILNSCKKDKNEANINETYQVKINSGECSGENKDIVVLFFESDFDDDLIEVTTNEHKSFEGRITTDNTLGLAKEISLGEIANIKQISFKINKGKPVVLDDLNCSFISINYIKGNVVTVDFSNKFISYN
ncbi:hypothetical protein [Aquimarina sp. Aq78]|uniref:hypothetical protein n=1 Tax=Aquimarina sp. Aq78 TaxID=1191889 RepID=UPI000D107CCB|nr:hypothetical protein [Aquimarina sp. Aq78]